MGVHIFCISTCVCLDLQRGTLLVGVSALSAPSKQESRDKAEFFFPSDACVSPPDTI